jgi:hypothetical protein
VWFWGRHGGERGEGGRKGLQQLTGEVGAVAGVAGGDLEEGARVGSSHSLVLQDLGNESLVYSTILNTPNLTSLNEILIIKT